MNFKLKSMRIFCALLLTAFASKANALQMGFECISNNSPESCMIGEDQLALDILKISDDQVAFNFSNTGTQASVITQIYVEDSQYISGIFTIDDSHSGVSFSEGATPKNLPAGSSISPVFTANESLSISADNPSPKKGVGPDEWVKVVYQIDGLYNADQLINAILSNDVRIGLHVQSFANGESEAYIATPISEVPEPATLALLGIGGLLLRTYSRKKNKA